MNETLIIILLILGNYLSGSISFAVLIAKWVKGVDIRKTGFKTAGGSNTSEVIGAKWGIIVAILDILKGVPILLLAKYLQIDDMWLAFISIAAVAGHCWPIWFGFSGGRGLATSVVGIVFLTPKIAPYPISIFLFSFVPYILRKVGIRIKIMTSPTITLLAFSVFIYLTFESPENFDEIYASLLMIIILIRRVTARIGEYKKYNPLHLFLSRLIFDSNPK